MFRVLVFCALIAVAGAGQATAPKAAPESDAELRARVAQFYQAHVDRKFRKAEEVVAEESKDAFYEAAKPPVSKYEIKDIAYSNDLTGAVVKVDIDTEFSMPGHILPSKRTMVSNWKLIDGHWFMLIDPSVMQTPFGPMKVAPRDGRAPTAPPAMPNFEAVLKADKAEVRFGSAPATAEISITTSMGAPVNLVLNPPAVPGLTAKLDRTAIKAKETATLTIAWKGGKLPSAPVLVGVGLKELPFSTTVKVVFGDGN